ncbi:MAG: 4-hydroxy-tetrahydrodipicolinate synthase [Deltaproteobacteria bacterium]|nr:4-hydroxy-tetrahydrodipicolinate synthase [Deltaproteobacteria bacterium]
MNGWHGVITALVTPFDEQGVDEAALGDLVESQIAAGLHGLLVCGTTGESAAMTAAERERAVRCVVERVAGRVPVLAGAGGNNTEATVEAVLAVQGWGADAALVVTPYYVKPSQAGMLEHYRAASEVGLPIVAYNVPGRTGVSLQPETTRVLAEMPSVVALKEASGDLNLGAFMMRAVGDGLSMLSGDDFTFLPFLSIGGKGAISVVSNVAPKEMVALFEAFEAGRLDEARRLQLSLLPLAAVLFCESNPIPVKAAMAMLGHCGPMVRTPLTRMGDAKAERLRAVLVEGGWLGGRA